MADEIIAEELGIEMISVEVTYALPGEQALFSVELPAGSTVMDAIERSGIRERFEAMEVDPKRLGIFSQRATPEQVLKDGDRVEIYRPLLVDPKEARRLRAEAEK